jgi:hypothetical protein
MDYLLTINNAIHFNEFTGFTSSNIGGYGSGIEVTVATPLVIVWLKFTPPGFFDVADTTQRNCP